MVSLSLGRFQNCPTSQKGTFAGFLAVLLWSSCIPVARSIAEQTGPLTAGGSVQLLGGVLVCSFCLLKGELFAAIRSQTKTYFVLGGAIFISYFLFLYLAIGSASNRVEFIGVGLLQYLWPTFTLLLSLALFMRRATLLLIPGIALATFGVYLSLRAGKEVTATHLLASFTDAPPAYLFAFAAALCWAIYSNLTKKLANPEGGNVVGVFMIAAGLALLIGSSLRGEMPNWPLQTCLELCYLGIVASLGYALWDFSMRSGDITIVAAFSYFTPLLFTVFGSLYLGVLPPTGLWSSCLCICLGAVLCSRGIRKHDV